MSWPTSVSTMPRPTISTSPWLSKSLISVTKCPRGRRFRLVTDNTVRSAAVSALLASPPWDNKMIARAYSAVEQLHNRRQALGSVHLQAATDSLAVGT